MTKDKEEKEEVKKKKLNKLAWEVLGKPPIKGDYWKKHLDVDEII